MADSGTSFTLDIQTRGKEGLDSAADSSDALATKLDVASKAIQAAELHYARTESAADRAARSVEKYALAIDVQNAKLAVAKSRGDDKSAAAASAKIEELAILQTKAQATSDRLTASLKSEAAALDEMKKSATEAAAAQKAKSDAADAAEKAAKAEADAATKNAGGEIKFQTLARALGKFGPLGDLVGRKMAEVAEGGEKLKAVLADVGPMKAFGLGLGAIAAALVVVSVAAAAATVKIVSWAVGLADANRQASLLAQGMVQSVKGGEALNAQVKALAGRLPLTVDQLGEMAHGLASAGYRGKDLQNALQQSATWAARLKFGPAFADEMLSLDEQSKVFKLNISNLFGGLNIDPLLRGLQTLGELFDKSTASGKAIKVVFESIFQPLVDALANSAPKIERFFLEFEILALRALIAIKPYGSTITKIGEAFAIGAALIAGVVVGAFALLAGAAAIVVAALGAVVVGLLEFDIWLGKLPEKITALVSHFGNIGKAMIEGLVDGIANAGGAVFDALKGVVTGAVDGVKGLLKINSPSKVFAAIGESTGEGMALGVDRSSPMVRSAYAGMVEPSDMPSHDTSPGNAPEEKSAGQITATFVFNGVQGAEDAEAKFRDLLTRRLEGFASNLGGMSPAKAM